mmetsp:Transcript_85616/g.261908  ORF Transcript_85616/g.261908 Transcript_85616/m.261908 type:complete len:218 (-) Transcript_85616:575-1228(-)
MLALLHNLHHLMPSRSFVRSASFSRAESPLGGLLALSCFMGPMLPKSTFLCDVCQSLAHFSAGGLATHLNLGNPPLLNGQFYGLPRHVAQPLQGGPTAVRDLGAMAEHHANLVPSGHLRSARLSTGGRPTQVGLRSPMGPLVDLLRGARLQNAQGSAHAFLVLHDLSDWGLPSTDAIRGSRLPRSKLGHDALERLGDRGNLTRPPRCVVRGACLRLA